MKDFCDFSRHKEMKGLGLKKLMIISNHLKACSASFPRAQHTSLLISTPFSGVEGRQLQQLMIQSM